MASKIKVISTTNIHVYANDVVIVEDLCDYISDKMNHKVDIEYNENEEDFVITVVEESMATYYPSNDYYEDDDFELDFHTDDYFNDMVFAFATEHEDEIEVNYVEDTTWEEA